MQVVFVSPHSDPEASLGEPDSGGQCIYEYELGKALAEIPQTEVHIFCRQTFHRPSISQVAPHLTVHRIECGPAKFIAKERIEPYLPAFANQVHQQLAQLKNQDIVIHGHYWDGGRPDYY